MANFCIIRAKKLKTAGSVGASIQHAFRDRETPNANPELTGANQHTVSSSAEAMAKFRKLLPEKIRSNAVVAVEYLITASPEAMAKMSREKKIEYFNESVKFLKKMHGAKNVFYCGIHLDETTPHLCAYVVPLDERGKLNCRSFLGGRQKLGILQTEFHKQVGERFELQRGIMGSRARHQEIKKYYRKLENADKSIQPPKRKLLETDEEYRDRYKNQIKPYMQLAIGALEAKRKNDEYAEAFREIKRGFKERNDFFAGLTEDQKKQMFLLRENFKAQNNQLQQHSRRSSRRLQNNERDDYGIER